MALRKPVIRQKRFFLRIKKLITVPDVVPALMEQSVALKKMTWLKFWKK
jgi:hypothetical protein